MGKLYPCIPVYIDTHTHTYREKLPECVRIFFHGGKRKAWRCHFQWFHILNLHQRTQIFFFFFFEHCSKYRFCNLSFYSVITKSVNVLLFVNVSLLNSASFTSHNFALASFFFFPRGEISPRGRRVFLSFFPRRHPNPVPLNQFCPVPLPPRSHTHTLTHRHLPTLAVRVSVIRRHESNRDSRCTDTGPFASCTPLSISKPWSSAWVLH